MVIEQQVDLLDLLHSIAHCNSADIKLRLVPRNQSKGSYQIISRHKNEYKQQVLDAKYLGNEKSIFHLIIKLRVFHEAYTPLPIKSLLALCDQMSLYQFEKMGILHLSCGLDKTNWTEVQDIFQKTFRGFNLALTVFTIEAPPERTTSDNHNTATNWQKTQSTDTGTKLVLTWIGKQSRPPLSHLQGLPRNVWKLWNLFDVANNPSRHSLPQAWQFQNQSNGFSTSRPDCVSSKYTPFSPLWPHECPSRSHEDFRKSMIPFLLARSKTRRLIVCCQVLCLSKTQQSLKETSILYEHDNPFSHSQWSVLNS